MEPIKDIPGTPPPRDYVRPSDADWSPFSIILAVVFALLLGYLLLGTTFTAPTPDRPVTGQDESVPVPSDPNRAPTIPTVPTPAPAPQ